MSKLKLGVIFGGMSTENEVSIVSGKNILENLDKEKYDIFPIYIDKEGNWFEYEENKKEILSINEYLKKLDVVFPVLHGKYGEDGTIQGLFELLKVPYVGCGVLSSSLGMDKIYTKIILKQAGIKQTRSCYIRKRGEKFLYVSENFDEEELKLNKICEKIENKIKYPMFVKPSNSGSSIGINKAVNIEDLKKYIIEASKYDDKILVEEGIEGRELECAVLGNDNVIAGSVGEIKPAEEFYTYNAKYNNSSSETIVPAEIPEETKEKIRALSIKAFKAIDGKGLARVDFFLEGSTNEIYLNEINTLPGFTEISMYPKLMGAYGMTYKELLDDLIKLAIENKNP